MGMLDARLLGSPDFLHTSILHVCYTALSATVVVCAVVCVCAVVWVRAFKHTHTHTHTQVLVQLPEIVQKRFKGQATK